MEERNELLEMYGVDTIEELKELLESDDERVADLKEFLQFVDEMEGE